MNHIKFAGLTNKWELPYAKAYADKLFEMGYFSKPIALADAFIVAYSHRGFVKDEMQQALNVILSQKDEGEISPEAE